MTDVVPHESWWRRRIVAPVIAQLKQGATPEKLALTVALGFILGVFPILGSATLLCGLVAWALRLNSPRHSDCQPPRLPRTTRTPHPDLPRRQRPVRHRAHPAFHPVSARTLHRRRGEILRRLRNDCRPRDHRLGARRAIRRSRHLLRHASDSSPDLLQSGCKKRIASFSCYSIWPSSAEQ